MTRGDALINLIPGVEWAWPDTSRYDTLRILTAGATAPTEAAIDAELARLSSYVDQRRAAYPQITDQLDAIWKGGADFVAMQKIVMAVKAQFPKP